MPSFMHQRAVFSAIFLSLFLNALSVAADDLYFQDLPSEDGTAEVEDIIQGDQLRGLTMYMAIKGMFRSRSDAEAFQKELAEMPDGVLEGLDFSTHYDGVARGFWLVFSAFESKEQAQEWLNQSVKAPNRKVTIKKVVKHNGTPIPFNRPLPVSKPDTLE